jgi:hypothetical protein
LAAVGIADLIRRAMTEKPLRRDAGSNPVTL